MTRQEALGILDAHRAEIRRRGVARLSLFGSVARDEADEDSDVDLLVEFSKPVGLFEFVELREYLADILGCEVDLVPRNSLKRQLRDQVLAEAVDAA